MRSLVHAIACLFIEMLASCLLSSLFLAIICLATQPRPTHTPSQEENRTHTPFLRIPCGAAAAAAAPTVPSISVDIFADSSRFEVSVNVDVNVENSVASLDWSQKKKAVEKDGGTSMPRLLI